MIMVFMRRHFIYTKIYIDEKSILGEDWSYFETYKTNRLMKSHVSVPVVEQIKDQDYKMYFCLEMKQ